MKALRWGTGSQALQGARLGMGTDPGEGYRKGQRDGGSGAPGKEPPGEWGRGTRGDVRRRRCEERRGYKSRTQVGGHIEQRDGAPAVGSALGLVLRPRRWRAGLPLVLSWSPSPHPELHFQLGAHLPAPRVHRIWVPEPCASCNRARLPYWSGSPRRPN